MVDIIGTAGNDPITGTSGNDRLEGLEGDDILNGLTGADSLYPSSITLSGRKYESGEVQLMDNGTNKLVHLLNELSKSNGKWWDGKHL